MANANGSHSHAYLALQTSAGRTRTTKQLLPPLKFRGAGPWQNDIGNAAEQACSSGALRPRLCEIHRCNSREQGSATCAPVCSLRNRRTRLNLIKF
jgi:hypothetical protein